MPVGKAYFGFTDEELKQIDKYVRDNTVERFGPVRSVRADRNNGLVLEVAFEGLNRSTRHKSGVAMTEKSATINARHSSRLASAGWGPVCRVSKPRGHAAPMGKGKTNG